jgi:glycosyltransferase involved in cell wall biosynthesis
VNQGGAAASEAAARRGIEAHVRSVGQLPQANPFYGAADVLVASSRGETMPFTVMESLCSGTPVVASDLPGHRYLGDQLEACTIVPRDAGRLAAAVAEFLDMEDEQRARICAAARDWIVEHLDVHAAAARLVDDYEQAALR